MKQKISSRSAALLVALLFELAGSCSLSAQERGLKGVGGLEAEPPASLEGANMLKNPGFEEGPTGWNIGKCFSIDGAVARSGKASLRFDPSAKCGSTRQSGLKRGAIAYTVRGWIKTDRVDQKGIPRISVFDSTHGAFVEAGVSGSGGTNDWQRFEVKGNVSSGLIDDIIEYRLHTAGVTEGTVWFDDLELVPNSELLKVFIRYPNFRGFLWDDGEQVIRGDVEVSLPSCLTCSLNDLEAEITIKDAADLNVLGKMVLTGLGSSNEFRWDAGKVSTGSEVILSARLKRVGDGSTLAEYPAYRVVKKPASFRAGLNNWIDGGNTLVHAGKPRFVWGVYDRMSGVRCSGCLGTRAAYYETIRGFDGLSTLDNYADTRSNTVIYFSPFSAANPGLPDKAKDQINPWAEALRSRGAMHLQIVNNYHDSSKYRPYWAARMTDDEVWRAIGTKITDDGLMGYYAADEPDLFGHPSVSEVFRQYQSLKDANKGSITLQVFSKPAPIYAWRDTGDVFSVDIYPLGSGPLIDDHLAGDITGPYFARADFWTEEAVKAVKESRPVWAVLQLWTQGGRFPVYEDMKKMAWKSIISGARGLLWWGFVSASGMESRWYGPYRGNCPQPCDPKAYDDFKRISTEVMALEEVILSRSEVFISASDSSIKLTAREGGDGFVYVFATNTTERSVPGVRFKAGEKRFGTVEVYSESRSIAASEQGWSDDFGPYDVHVYRAGALH